MEVIKVKYKDKVIINGQEASCVLINECDFNKDLHIKIDETKKKKSQPENDTENSYNVPKSQETSKKKRTK